MAATTVCSISAPENPLAAAPGCLTVEPAPDRACASSSGCGICLRVPPGPANRRKRFRPCAPCAKVRAAVATRRWTSQPGRCAICAPPSRSAACRARAATRRRQWTAPLPDPSPSISSIHNTQGAIPSACCNAGADALGLRRETCYTALRNPAASAASPRTCDRLGGEALARALHAQQQHTFGSLDAEFRSIPGQRRPPQFEPALEALLAADVGKTAAVDFEIQPAVA